MEAWLDMGGIAPIELEPENPTPPTRGGKGHLQLVANQNRDLAARYAGRGA
jgi:hypothetical protein